MTATDTTTEVNLEELWDEVLPCWYDGCGAEPTHRMINPCCGHNFFLCEEHTLTTRNLVQVWMSNPGGHEITCAHCLVQPVQVHLIRFRKI